MIWRAQVIELATLENGDIVTTGEEFDNLSKIRFAESVEIPAQTQKKVDVSSLLQDFVVTDPKHEVMKKYGVRVWHGLHEVRDSVPFIVLVRKFSRRLCTHPKGMVVAYESRSPLAQNILEGGASRSYAPCTISLQPLRIPSPEGVELTQMTKQETIHPMTKTSQSARQLHFKIETNGVLRMKSRPFQENKCLS